MMTVIRFVANGLARAFLVLFELLGVFTFLFRRAGGLPAPLAFAPAALAAQILLICSVDQFRTRLLTLLPIAYRNLPLGTWAALAAAGFTLLGVLAWQPEFCQFLIKSLQRNKVRTALSSLAVFVLVLVVTMVWSILAFIDKAVEDKEGEQKIIITEANQIPSQMPPAYATALKTGAAEVSPGYRLGDAGLRKLIDDGLPRDVVDALARLKDQRFPSQPDYVAAAEGALGARPIGDQEAGRIVSRHREHALDGAQGSGGYQLTAQAEGALKNGGVPADVVSRLAAAVKGRSFPDERAYLDGLTQALAKLDRGPRLARREFNRYSGKIVLRARLKGAFVEPLDWMTWGFYGGDIVKDREKQSRETFIIFFFMDPDKFMPMMDGLDDLSEDQRAQLEDDLEKLQVDKRNILVGEDRLKALNKQIGEKINVYPKQAQYKDIELECNIVGILPTARYGQNSVAHVDLLYNNLEKYEHDKGEKHQMATKAMNLVWLKVANKQDYQTIAQQINRSPAFTVPAVKCEQASSAITSFLEGFRTLFWFMRYPLSLAVFFTLVLVIANAISIGVRERQTEMAVLKVIGFQPIHILTLVLGEALLIGGLSGVACAGVVQFLVNGVFHGVKFPIAFFPVFFIAKDAWWWGLALGSTTGLLGSIVPALSARTVKVSDVFAKVA